MGDLLASASEYLPERGNLVVAFPTVQSIHGLAKELGDELGAIFGDLGLCRKSKPPINDLLPCDMS